MSRMRKKCLIVSMGMHLLLLLVVVFGVAFATTSVREPQDKVLTMRLESDPVAQPEPVQQNQMRNVRPQPLPPTPRVPQHIRRPEPPRPTPRPVNPAPVEAIRNPPPRRPKHARNPPKRKINLSSTVVELTLGGQNSKPKTRPRPNPRPQTIKVDIRAADKLRNNLSGKTKVNFKANSSTYNRYKDVVASVYEAKWNRGLPPKSTSYRNKIIRVRVTISKSGRVVSSRIVGRSGMVALDNSVQATLNAVRSIGQSFPPGVQEREQTFTINFQDKR